MDLINLINLIPTFLSLKRFKVEGNSMNPLLLQGDRVLVFTKKNQQIIEGDLVLAINPLNGKKIVKQVKKINGKKIFLIGVNEKESTDSREFGEIERENLIGKVWKKY